MKFAFEHLETVRRLVEAGGTNGVKCEAVQIACGGISGEHARKVLAAARQLGIATPRRGANHECTWYSQKAIKRIDDERRRIADAVWRAGCAEREERAAFECGRRRAVAANVSASVATSAPNSVFAYQGGKPWERS